jgi:predicted nucleotidyltransferase
MMTNFEELLKKLVEAQIKFILVGGWAAIAQGSDYVTMDLDICYARESKNIKKLVGFLKNIDARLRDVPGDLPFQLDEKTFSMGMNFTFETNLGPLDLWGELAGLGGYDHVMKYSEALDLYGLPVNILSLEGLIKAKKAAGRPKDLLQLKELEALKELKKN